jgi:hypothetical protein
MNPGVSLQRTGCLPASSAGFVRAPLDTDDLDEREHRRGIEEVHADHAFRPLRGLGDLRDRERGGVRREDRVRPADSLELGKEPPLRLQLFDDRLDDEVAVGQVVELGRQRQPPEGRVLVGLGHAPFLHGPAEVALDRRAGAFVQLVGDLPADRRMPRLGADLGDARAHRPQPDNSNPLDLHGAGA